MQQSILLPAFLYVVGLIAVVWYERPRHTGFGAAARTGDEPGRVPAPTPVAPRL
jgi:hypothetical protein